MKMINKHDVHEGNVKATIYEVNHFDVKKDYLENFPFIIGDAISLLSGFIHKYKIFYIYNFDMNQDEKESAIKEIVEKYKNEYIILTDAYISLKEFPEESYYIDDSDKDDNKKKIDVDAILERESKILENCGFVNVNNILGLYEYKISFVHGSKYDIILEAMDKNNQ